MLQAILQGLVEGQTVAEAVWAAGQQCHFELEYVRAHIIVMGAPNVTATTKGGGGGKRFPDIHLVDQSTSEFYEEMLTFFYRNTSSARA